MIIWQMHRPPNLRRQQRLELDGIRRREKLGSQPQPALPGRACLERCGAGLIECDPQSSAAPIFHVDSRQTLDFGDEFRIHLSTAQAQLEKRSGTIFFKLWS